MTPAPQLPKPLNYAFPVFVPGRYPIPPDFQLWPEAFYPDLKAGNLPQTPPIPPPVATGDVITSGHENTVSNAINDLWIDVQWLASNSVTDPTTVTGDILVRGASGITAQHVGANGTVLTADSTQPTGLKWNALTASSVGAVPTTRQVIAGAGLTGGGALSADVTLSAAVTSVFGRTGAIVLTTPDLTGASGVVTSGSYADPAWITSLSWSKLASVPAMVMSISPGVLTGAVMLAGSANVSVTQSGQTITIAASGLTTSATQIIAGTGLTGGGPLTANVTLSAVPMSPSGPSHSLGYAPDPGATAGTGRFLREDATWAVPPSGSGGIVGTANYVPIFTSASTIGNSVIYQNGSNIGIATTAAGSTLDVAGGLRIAGTSPPTTGIGLELSYSSGVGRAYVLAYNRSTPAYIPLFLQGNPIVTGGGYVGIATNSPTQPLEVAGATYIHDASGGQSNSTLNVTNSSTSGNAYGTQIRSSSSNANNNALYAESNGGSGSTNFAVQAAAVGSASINYGVYVNVLGATTNYGIRIVAPPAAANNYAIYSDAPAQSYFAG